MFDGESKFIPDRGGKEEAECVEDQEIIRYLKIGNKFWNKICKALQCIGLPNIGEIKLRFNVKNNNFGQTAEKFKNQLKAGEDLMLGSFNIDTSIISFNFNPDDYEEDSIAEIVIHEFIHYIQEMSEKYPEMVKQGDKGDNSPWEEEAYRLSPLLINDFLKDCAISEY